MFDTEFDYSRYPYVKIVKDAWTYFFDNPNVTPPRNVKELENGFIKWLSHNKLDLNKKMTRNIRLIITPDRMRRRKSIILKEIRT
jgi:hypothetical protein